MILKDFAAQAVTAAIEENLFGAFANSGRLPQAELHDDPDMMWFITGVPFPLLNGVFRARLAADGIDTKIEATLARFKSRQVPMIWWTGPATRPAGLGKHLEAQGLSHAEDLPGMAVDLRTLRDDLSMPAGLTIEPVGDMATLEHWLHAFTAGFELSDLVAKAFFDLFAVLGFGSDQPFRHYVGWLRGKPVAASSRFLGAGVVGIYNVATVPDARRKGIGAALTLAPLHEARTSGYRVGILHSTPIGVGVYRSLGFQEYCKVSLYALDDRAK